MNLFKKYMMHKWLLCFIVVFQIADVVAQKNILIPYRVGDKFGLSDVDGRIRLKPVYDFIEPIGSGYFKYANYTAVPDTVWYANGRMEVGENKLSVTGVLKGTKKIISNTEHNHFRYVDMGILIGSEESYISKNSNFYTLSGKKLLPENVEKFRFLARNSEEGYSSQPAFISIFAEHYNNTVSLFLFDTKKQEISLALLDQVSNFILDRSASTGGELVCSYTDAQHNYQRMRIYFDEEKQHHVKEIYNEPERPHHNDLKDRDSEGYSGSGRVHVEARSEKMTDSTPSTPVPPRPTPPPVFYFIKQSDSLIRYGENNVKLKAGEKVSFSERHAKQQKHPLILSNDNKKCLLFSDTSRSVYYDSLRYIRNSSVFTSNNQTFIYLGGNKDPQTGSWRLGLLDEQGNEIIPLLYESISPNINELGYERDMTTRKDSFIFKQPYVYSVNSQALLTLQREGYLIAKLQGQYGIINLKNEILMSFEYDAIWKNGLSFLKTVPVEEKFYVYQKGEKFGVFKHISKLATVNDTGLIFSYIPVFMYKDYAGVAGFDLYNLAKPGNLFFCLAGSNGKLYYQTK